MKDFLLSIDQIGYPLKEFRWQIMEVGDVKDVHLIHEPTGTVTGSTGRSDIKTRDECLRKMKKELDNRCECNADCSPNHKCEKGKCAPYNTIK